MEIKITDQSLPNTFQSADGTAKKAQNRFYFYQFSYSFVLIGATIVAYFWPENSTAALITAVLFLFTLIIMAALQIEKPDDLWFNCRDIAESVKSDAWRWMMKANPYVNDFEQAKKLFLNELAYIQKDNVQIFTYTKPDTLNNNPISDMMKAVRDQHCNNRLQIYIDQRINEQLDWYKKKTERNEKNSKIYFACSFIFHAIAIIMLFYRIQNPISLPVEIVVTCASAALTWGQSKKYKELNVVYSSAAYEMSIIKAKADEVKSDEDLSSFVLESESAFKNERTTARQK